MKDELKSRSENKVWRQDLEISFIAQLSLDSKPQPIIQIFYFSIQSLVPCCKNWRRKTTWKTKGAKGSKMEGSLQNKSADTVTQSQTEIPWIKAHVSLNSENTSWSTASNLIQSQINSGTWFDSPGGWEMAIPQNPLGKEWTPDSSGLITPGPCTKCPR
jgi:hypothetical protein